MIKLNLINSDRIYQSILEGRPYNQDLKPYSKIEIESCIRQFIESEEYEKCQYLTDFMKSRFDHDKNWLL